MWLTDMETMNGLQGQDVVPVVKEEFPKYDHSLHSKVKRPDLYGIELTKRATETICKHFQFCPVKPRRSDNRKNPYRIQGRLGKSLYDRLQTTIRESGWATMQDFLEFICIYYLEHKNEIHPKEATSD
jgi:hypothetical protein